MLVRRQVIMRTYTKNNNVDVSIDFKAIVFVTQVVLVIFKFAGILNVSWWIIFLPTLLPAGGFALLFVVVLIGCFISKRFRRMVMMSREDD